MKGLKEFIEDLAKDNKLREKFKDLKDVKEIVKLAEKEGYKFTEAEYMDKQMEAVSGGKKTNIPSWMSAFAYQNGGKLLIDKWLEFGKDPNKIRPEDLGAFVMSGGRMTTGCIGPTPLGEYQGPPPPSS